MSGLLIFGSRVFSHIDFLSDAEDRERTAAYHELENGHSLDLKDIMKEW